jgi:DNA-binding NarL/FixJ family response regulator
VRDLQTGGYVWEAAQLAGQAAIRVEDATLAKSLLGQARSLRGGAPAAATTTAPVSAVPADSGSVTPAGLSDREVEVARLVLNGLTHKAIGATLYISPKTVEHHVAHIRQKLGASNRAEFLAALREDLAALSDV